MPVHSATVANPTLRLTILVVAIGFMALEYLLSRLARHHHETHDLHESAATLGVAAGHALMRPLEAAVVAVPYAFAYSHRLLDFEPATPIATLALFVCTEFVYYWHHRLSHRVRWMWATHAVHHSPTKLNLTAALRLGWTSNISGSFLFFLPLAWIGFHPFAVVGMLGINLLYQFFIHTELAPRLGLLEWVLNTPSHHRVHHASNASCRDRNFGGILIVFDRLFGTFLEAPRHETLSYGLSGVAPTFNPLRIAFGEWAALAGDVRNAPTFFAKFRAAFAPPGSMPGQSPNDDTSAAAAVAAGLFANRTITEGERHRD
jgi:sterol desaturase/sphingolipid hydroxylase (fatty acid hydroxylase superfamily)